MKNHAREYLEHCPFFEGYQGDGKAIIDVAGFARWIESSERETRHLLESPAMAERLGTALGREGGRTLDEVKRELDL